MDLVQRIKLTSWGNKKQEAKPAFKFTSLLTAEHLPELERLLFFNPQQNRYSKEIMQVIEDNGLPKIVKDRQRLKICIGEQQEVNSIFALTQSPAEQLVGVIVFTRPDDDQIMILHVAVDQEYSFQGSHADALLTFRLIEAVQHLASKVKGVTRVGLMYGRHTGRTLFLPVLGKETRQA